MTKIIAVIEGNTLGSVVKRGQQSESSRYLCGKEELGPEKGRGGKYCQWRSTSYWLRLFGEERGGGRERGETLGGS